MSVVACPVCSTPIFHPETPSDQVGGAVRLVLGLYVHDACTREPQALDRILAVLRDNGMDVTKPAGASDPFDVPVAISHTEHAGTIVAMRSGWVMQAHVKMDSPPMWTPLYGLPPLPGTEADLFHSSCTSLV